MTGNCFANHVGGCATWHNLISFGPCIKLSPGLTEVLFRGFDTFARVKVSKPLFILTVSFRCKSRTEKSTVPPNIFFLSLVAKRNFHYSVFVLIGIVPPALFSRLWSRIDKCDSFVFFCSDLFRFILFCSVLFCSVLFRSVLFFSILFCSGAASFVAGAAAPAALSSGGCTSGTFLGAAEHSHPKTQRHLPWCRQPLNLRHVKGAASICVSGT